MPASPTRRPNLFPRDIPRDRRDKNAFSFVRTHYSGSSILRSHWGPAKFVLIALHELKGAARTHFPYPCLLLGYKNRIFPWEHNRTRTGEQKRTIWNIAKNQYPLIIPNENIKQLVAWAEFCLSESHDNFRQALTINRQGVTNHCNTLIKENLYSPLILLLFWHSSDHQKSSGQKVLFKFPT